MDLFGAEPAENHDDETEFHAPAPPPVEPLFESARTMPFCLGHEAQEQTLLESYRAGQLPHGMIFTGPQGIGKATFAFRFARFLLKVGLNDSAQDGLFGEALPQEDIGMDVAPDDPVFRQIASGGHPDLFVVERAYDAQKNKTKDAVDVAEVRKITGFLRKTSSYGGWRVVIIDDADTMNRNAQNALLKILEEPPANAVIILVAHRAGAFLPTIRSRVRMVPFSALDEDIMSDLLTRSGVSGGMAEMIRFADGRFSQALSFGSSNFQNIYESVHDAFQQARKPDWVHWHRCADDMGKRGGEADFELFRAILIAILTRVISARARGTHHAADEELMAMFAPHTPEVLMALRDDVDDLFATAVHGNLDKRQAVLQAFCLIETSFS